MPLFHRRAMAWIFLLQFANVSAEPQDTVRTEVLPGDLLSQYNAPSKGPGLFTHLAQTLGLKGSPARQGDKAYRAQDYDLALQKYAEAALDQPESHALAYNAGNAEFRKKRYAEAIAAFTKALGGSDAALSAQAHYNLGNAYFRKGEAALQAGKQEGISDYREALAQYKKSLEIRSENLDAKRNIEVVQARIKELLDRQEQQQQQQPQQQQQKPPEPSPKAKEALARALQLAQQRRYDQAKAVLESIIAEDPTAASFQGHLQRLDDVMKILKGEKPSAPAPQDPRAGQGGLGVI